MPEQVGDMVSGALLAAARNRPCEAQAATTSASPRRRLPGRLVFLVAATLLCTSGLALARTDAARRALQYAQVALGIAQVQVQVQVPSARAARASSQAATPASVTAPKSTSPEGSQEPATVGGIEPPSSPTPESLRASHKPAVPRTGKMTRARRMPRNPVQRGLGPQRRVPVVVEPAAAAAESASQAPAAREFALARAARRDGHMDDALARFERLAEAYPGREEGQAALVLSARMRLTCGEPQAALVGYQRYLEGGARGLREQALVGVAEAQRRLGAQDGLRETLRRLREEYPDSPRLRLFEEALEP